MRQRSFHVRRLLIAWFLVGGCTTDTATPTLLSVEPNVVQPDSSTTVRLNGEDFELRFTSSIETGDTKVEEDFVLVLGDLEIEVEFLDEASLQASLPSGLAPGIYDVEVRAPTGRAILAQALTVAPLPVDLLWGEPTLITEVSSSDFADQDPSATDDLLVLYFASRRPGGAGSHNIWVAKRTSSDLPWNAPELVVELSSDQQDWGPEVSRDGLSILLASGREGGGAVDVYEATRASRSDSWSVPVRVVELATPQQDSSAAMSDSGLYLALDSNRDGGQSNLYMADRSSTSDPWSPMTRLAISSSDHDWCPHFTRGALEIMFASQRGSTNFDGFDIYIAARPDSDSPFEAPTRVTEVNSDTHDSCPWMSSDGRTLIFNSNRDGENSIYQATR